MSGITKAERAELRGVVKQQFKVLAAELEQRRAELLARVEDEIAGKFADDDKAWSDAKFLAREAASEANRKVNDAYRHLIDQGDGHSEGVYVSLHPPEKPSRERAALRVQASRHLDAQVRGAQLALQRQEADLLRTLAVGAIESEEAHAFLAAIPSVGELVPAARLAELEATLGSSD